MTYFEELDHLPVYPSQGPDFRFTYNSNSGGGNSFLAGRPVNDLGHSVPAGDLDGKQGVFQYVFNSPTLGLNTIILDDDRVKYEIKPRAAGASNMKLGVAKKVNPSAALISFFMLPEGCGARKSANLDQSVLAKNNYWLQQMRLDSKEVVAQPGTVHLALSDLVFSGGVEAGGNTGNQRYFRLDTEKRIRDVIDASASVSLPAPILKHLELFAEIYTGKRDYNYDETREATNNLMRETAASFPTLYSGIDDPLPALMQVRGPRLGASLKFETGLRNREKRNRVIFGAPGTGKSYWLDKDKDVLLANGGKFERVTFHPDYTYANFVGTYKPVPMKDMAGNETITYRYIPGPFMRIIAAALLNGQAGDVQPHLLLIEEINRASATAVFGEVFQLLDRNRDNVSQYPIHTSVDIQNYLSETLGGEPIDYEELRIPDNMFIWGSMNSADQGVFPMDTAFKRRWDFVYTGINDNDGELVGKLVTLGSGSAAHTIEWNTLRKSINDFLATKGVNEDKQIGPYFLSRDLSVPNVGHMIDQEAFVEAFQQKVIMYLFEDAARQHRASLFEGCKSNHNRYSDICQEFQNQGIRVFNAEIISGTPFETIPNATAGQAVTSDSNEG